MGADDGYPGVFLPRQLLAKSLDAGAALGAPDDFGLLRMTRQIQPVGGFQKISTALGRQASGPDDPGQQQAEGNLQQRQLPQQRVTAHQPLSVSIRM
jgi:hypothetical protein